MCVPGELRLQKKLENGVDHLATPRAKRYGSGLQCFSYTLSASLRDCLTYSVSLCLSRSVCRLGLSVSVTTRQIFILLMWRVGRLWEMPHIGGLHRQLGATARADHKPVVPRAPSLQRDPLHHCLLSVVLSGLHESVQLDSVARPGPAGHIRHAAGLLRVLAGAAMDIDVDTVRAEGLCTQVTRQWEQVEPLAVSAVLPQPTLELRVARLAASFHLLRRKRRLNG